MNKRLKNNDNQEQLFREVMETYESVLWRVVLTYEANNEQQQELFQDILLGIWKSLANFKQLSSVQTFVYRVAHNTALSHVHNSSRKLKDTDKEFDAACEKSNPELTHSQKQYSILLANAVRQLPLNFRQLISLSLEGLTYPEIGDVLGMSANNVGVNLSRARQKLKLLIEDKINV